MTLSKIARVIVLTCVASCSPLAQTRHQEPVAIKEAFMKSFNSASSVPFYALLNKECQENNQVDELNKKFRRAGDYIGRITSMELKNSTDHSFTYLISHRMATMKVVFDLDNKGQVDHWSLSSHTYNDQPKLERNLSDLILPFDGEWYVYWGGSTVRQNYHNSSPNMRGAFDFYVRDEAGRSYRTNGSHNEDYYAFGKEIKAPVDGKIIFIRDGIKDNDWPAMNKQDAAGNIIMLETVNKEYLVFAHLKENSIKVSEGEWVSQGALLGLCGNSGMSTEPHLHFQVQNLPDLVSPRGAFVYFRKIRVNGQIREDYMPVKADVISN